MALIRRTFGWETEKWDFRKSAKTEADFRGEEQLRNLGEEEDEEEKPATEQTREYTDLGVGFRLEKRESCLPYLSLGGDDKRGMSGSEDVSLTIFIASESGSESLTFLTNRFFYFSGPLGLVWRLMWPKGMEYLAAFSVREVKRAPAEKKEVMRILLQTGSESRSKKQSHPNKLSEN